MRNRNLIVQARQAFAQAALVFFIALPNSQAGVFNLPHFVPPGDFALGVEPELILSHGAGLAANFKYTQGVNDLMNIAGILGTGGGPRRFRVGGNVMLDFFPDIEGQPGLGIGTQALYYRLDENGLLEITLIPYIHKTFISNGHEVEPYFALPLGAGFSDGQYHAISSAVVGAMFKTWQKFRTNLEFGISINNSETYLSGGLTYYH